MRNDHPYRLDVFADNCLRRMGESKVSPERQEVLRRARERAKEKR